MAILPATGAAIAMGAVYIAYQTAGTTATQASLAGTGVKLSATLGVSYGGKSLGASIAFSSTFGGKTTPNTYWGNL